MYRIFLLAIFCLAVTLARADDDANVKLFEIHSRLAAKGSSEAQFKLGEMCEEGRGTPRDLGKAKEWYELAASQGHAEAKQRLATLGQRRPYGDTVKMEREAQLLKQREEEERQAALAQKREEEERRNAAERRRSEEERLTRQRDEAERQRQLQAQKRAEEERARTAAAQRKQEERALPITQPPPPKPGPVPAQPQSAGGTSATLPGSDSKQESFESDPCKGAAARFMSTCR
ncbi:MAG TPA: hypothetical protein VGE50_08815 [Gammaproteobacteria bacterium]